MKEEPHGLKTESCDAAQPPPLEGTTDTSNFYIRLFYGHRKKIRKTTFKPLLEFTDLVNIVVSAFPGVKKEKYHLEWEKTWLEDEDDWEAVFSDWKDRDSGDVIAGKRCMDLEIISDNPTPARPTPAPAIQQDAATNARKQQPTGVINASNWNNSNKQQYRSPQNNMGGNWNASSTNNRGGNWNTSSNFSHQQNSGWNRSGAGVSKKGPAGFRNHDQKMEALWQLCTQIMRQNPRGMNVLHLRVECMRKGWPEGKPRVKDVNFLLYKHQELGALYKEQLDPTSKPKWRLAC